MLNSGICSCVRRFGKPSGFTLLELLVVIGIMALMTTLTIAGYMGSSQALAQKRGATQLVNVLTQARQKACLGNTRVGVLFSRSEKDGVTALYSLCTELGVVYNGDFFHRGGGYIDFFGNVVEKLRGEMVASSSGSGKSYTCRLVDIANGTDVIAYCGVERESFGPPDKAGSLTNGYVFVSGTQGSMGDLENDKTRMPGHGIMLWSRASQTYAAPAGYELNVGGDMILFNADGSLGSSVNTVSAKFKGAKSKGSLDFVVTINPGTGKISSSTKKN